MKAIVVLEVIFDVVEMHAAVFAHLHDLGRVDDHVHEARKLQIIVAEIQSPASLM